MSRLNYASLGDAFRLGSDQIKDTQKEIDTLKKLITETSITKNKELNPDTILVKDKPNTSASAKEVTKAVTNEKSESIDILKIIQHPQFEDIVKNYIIVKRPEWVNGVNQQSYFQQPKQSYQQSYFQQPKQSYQQNYQQSYFQPQQQPTRRSVMNFANTSKSYFGSPDYSTTVCSNIKSYLIFFIITLCTYIAIKLFVEKA